MYIIGAGYTGLIAGVLFPKAIILEASPAPMQNHTALLRFRTPKIGEVINIPFDKVPVSKAIWYDGSDRNPSPRFSNLYSKKVTGEFLPRSIGDISEVERYIAPDNLYDQLIELCWDRIRWGHQIDFIDNEHILAHDNNHPDKLVDDGAQICINRDRAPIVATIPINYTARALSIPFKGQFSNNPIATYRLKLKTRSRCFYTVYYPDPNFPAYRASITGDTLIVEGMMAHQFRKQGTNDYYLGHNNWIEIFKSLGIWSSDFSEEINSQKATEQKYGKITPMHELARKTFIHTATTQFGVYSLGRFGTWRNILLDDIYKDIQKIKQLIKLEPYELKLRQV